MGGSSGALQYEDRKKPQERASWQKVQNLSVVSGNLPGMKPKKSLPQRISEIEARLDFCLDKIAKHEVKLDKIWEQLR